MWSCKMCLYLFIFIIVNVQNFNFRRRYINTEHSKFKYNRDNKINIEWIII